MGHFPGSFAKISKLTEITFLKSHQISGKSSVLLNPAWYCNSDHSFVDFFTLCRLLRLWKVMRVCLWITWPSAFLCIIVRQILQQSRLLMPLMIRNPTNIRSPSRWLIFGRHTEIPYVEPLFRLFQLVTASSHRPPHMRKAENSGFSNGGGRNLQND